MVHVVILLIGNLYIADFLNQRIRKVTVSMGIITTIAGTGTGSYTGDDGPATSATLNNPYGVAVDTSGNVYIADYSNNRIRKVTVTTKVPTSIPTYYPTISLSSDIISTIAGTGIAAFSGDNTIAMSAAINYPYGVAIDASGRLRRAIF